MNAISVIVPTLNEVDNVRMLVERIAANFDTADLDYEVIFIDDHSTDGTQAEIVKLAIDYPVRLRLKQGERGKAHSLLEGFAAARYDTLCMIDADLQYPPEAIVPMYQLMHSSGTDIVLTNRLDHGTSALRKLTSTGFNFVFTKMMFGFNYDSQSGLKLFKRKVIDDIILTPTPWSFDLEFIVRALEKNYKIVSYDITFAERYSGVAKIQVSKVAVELAKASVKLRFNSSPGKVKKAYKKNSLFVEKAMMASLFALLAASILSFATLGHSAGLALAVAPKDPITGLIPTTPTVPLSVTPTTVAPTDTTTPATPTPVSTPTTTTPPVESPASSSTTATPTVQAAPTNTSNTSSAPTTPSQTSQPSSTPNTYRRSANTYAPPLINGNGYTAPQDLTTTTTPTASSTVPNNSTLATFPAGGNKTPAFGYTNRKPSRATAYVRPLAFIGIAVVLAGLAIVAILSLVPRIRSNNRPNQEAFQS